MEFFIEKHSSVPVIKQIQEQVKLAVAMGIVREGDRLPSIRQVERQAGINRAQVHRAYQALSQSGLLVMTPGRGKGAVLDRASLSPEWINAKSEELTKNLISRVRQLGLSPTAYARYLSRRAQETERRAPLIAYVDPVKPVATRRAEEVSQLWQVPVIGLTIQELEGATRKGPRPRKVLVNHLMRDYVQSSLLAKKVEVIPVEVRYTEQTIKELAQIKPHSSVLRILPSQFLPHARFILAQLQKWISSPGVELSYISLSKVSIEELVKDSPYDRIIVGPGTLDEMPHEVQKSSRILVVRMQLDARSLEICRIRAGVIV